MGTIVAPALPNNKQYTTWHYQALISTIIVYPIYFSPKPNAINFRLIVSIIRVWKLEN